MSVNSFPSVVGGVQLLIDASLGNKLDPQMGRFFEDIVSDPTLVSEWNSNLSKWGEKSLEKLDSDKRKAEQARREAGASAARAATRLAVTNGGELTIGPLIGADSVLSASKNMLMLGLSPSDLLDHVLIISASAGDQAFKGILMKMKSIKIDFGLRMKTIAGNFTAFFICHLDPKGSYTKGIPQHGKL